MSTLSGIDRSVLVVEDHAQVRALVVALLENAGIEVLVADSGPAGIQLFRDQGKHIGCVLQDLSMPDMRGEEVIATLLQIDPAVKIVVMSADPQEFSPQLKDLAISGYLQKPFEPALLISTVQALLGVKKAQEKGEFA